MAQDARSRGPARPQHHGRQRQDLRGGARAQRRAGARGDAVVPRGHGGLRARDAGLAAARDRDDAGDRRPDRGAAHLGARVHGGRRRLLPRRRLRELRRPVGSASRPGRGAGAQPGQGGPARLRPLEGDEGGRGHLVGGPLGGRPPRLAHRMLGDGREGARPGVLDPRRGARPRLPASRERARAIAVRRASVRTGLDAQRAAALHGREDVEVDRERGDDPRRARHLGRGDGARVLPHGALAQADRLLGGDDDRSAGTGGDPPERASRRDAYVRRLGGVRRGARGRLQHARRPRGPPRLGPHGRPGRASPRPRRVRPRDARGPSGAPRRDRRAGRGARCGPGWARLRRGRPATGRDRISRLGSARRGLGYELVPRA